ncbi:MAG: riboflavin synthase [Candidatus Marinimicrobia bacterium]|nr:riboflavin synthase [Candidatus Neomarinimicrobiota bacterium]|tara:strand:+ start:8746 stop:9345 length:600 start_codon:yes stop_codon:yes gene_type:complete
MFTGLIEETGKIGKIILNRRVTSINVYCKKVLSGLKIGDSVSVSGICLTVIKIEKNSFWVDLVSETINRSTAKKWKSGSIVNLERALSFSDRLGGHLVQGHIDGVSFVKSIQKIGNSWKVEFSLDENFSKYIVEKGSIAIDGISLTVAGLSKSSFTVCLIPKTLNITTLENIVKGDEVNIEIDMIAKHLEKLLGNSPNE